MSFKKERLILYILGVLISYPLCYYEHEKRESDSEIVFIMKRNTYYGECIKDIKVNRLIITEKTVKLIFTEGVLEGQQWSFLPEK